MDFKISLLPVDLEDNSDSLSRLSYPDEILRDNSIDFTLNSQRSKKSDITPKIKNITSVANA